MFKKTKMKKRKRAGDGPLLKTLDFSEIRTLIAAVEGRCADRLTSYLLYERHERHFNKYFFYSQNTELTIY